MTHSVRDNPSKWAALYDTETGEYMADLENEVLRDNRYKVLHDRKPTKVLLEVFDSTYETLMFIKDFQLEKDRVQ